MIEDDIRWSKQNKDYQELDSECLNSFFSEMINYKMNHGSDKGGGVAQRLLVGTKRNAYAAQLQNSVHGTFFAATKYRTQPFLSRKIIQNQHYKIQCIWS